MAEVRLPVLLGPPEIPVQPVEAVPFLMEQAEALVEDQEMADAEL